jgi:hypothetical protein
MKQGPEDLDKRTRKILFRERHGLRYSLSAISKLTGIPVTTLRRYEEIPETIPFGRLITMAEAMEITPEECGELILGAVK